MYIQLFIGIWILLLFSGCAIHPVPEDVTGVDTYHIVRQIRCETRNAVIDFLKAQLRQWAEEGGNPLARQLLEQYESDPESISTFNPTIFSAPEQRPSRYFSNLIYSAAIAYNFDLTMTEQNDLGTNINLLGPWKSKFTLNINGDANRQRSNQRTFTVTDTFQFLLANLNSTDKTTGVPYCYRQIVQPNYVYPIAGEIGVYKTVQTFFELTVLGGLSADKAKPGEGGAPTMTDNLKFTTTVDLSGTPKVVFTPVGSGFQLADASLTGLAKRSDVHQVTIGLALEPSGAVDVGPLRGFLFSGPSRVGRTLGPAARGMATGPVLVGNRVTGTGATLAEQLAVLAIDQVKSREIQLITSP